MELLRQRDTMTAEQATDQSAKNSGHYPSR